MINLLSAFANPTPYYSKLRPLAGSVTATILLVQLEYWFAKYPDGFYKFTEKCSHEAYSPGDSWTEELGFSKHEFSKAFSKLGIAHKSLTAYRRAGDQSFERADGSQAFYCSFHNKKTGQTFYFRNHQTLEAATAKLFTVSEESSLTEVNKGHFCKLKKSTSVSEESSLTEVKEVNLPYTEITSEITPEITQIREEHSQNEISFSHFVTGEFLDSTALTMHSFPWGTVDRPNAQLIEHLIRVYLPTVEPYSKQKVITPHDAGKYVKGMKNKFDLFKSELRFDTIQSEWQKSVELRIQAEQHERVRQESLNQPMVESVPATSTEVLGIEEVKRSLPELSRSRGYARLSAAVDCCPLVSLGERSIAELSDLEWKSLHDWLKGIAGVAA